MKKILSLLSFAAILTTSACSDQPSVTKEVVVVTPAKVVEKEVPEKSTSISVDKNGVKVASKKIDVVVNKQ
jgi:hypothetical protein